MILGAVYLLAFNLNLLILLAEEILLMQPLTSGGITIHEVYGVAGKRAGQSGRWRFAGVTDQ